MSNSNGIKNTSVTLICEDSDQNNDNSTCKTNLSTVLPSWKSSKSYINEQIRRLRAQLFELKVCTAMDILTIGKTHFLQRGIANKKSTFHLFQEIRRYLKNKKPYSIDDKSNLDSSKNSNDVKSGLISAANSISELSNNMTMEFKSIAKPCLCSNSTKTLR